MRRARRLEGRVYRGRGTELALPLLRQGVTSLTGTVIEHCLKSLVTVTGYQDRFALCDTVRVDDLVLPTRMLILKS